ncbi:hypothetical protein ACP3V5_25460 [Vibrio maritimus]|jgi:hypothetical protein
MDDLIRELRQNGLCVEQKGTKLQIKFKGLSNPVYISNDIPTSAYILNTNDWLIALSSSAAFTSGLVAMQSGSLFGALMVPMGLIGYLSVLLTELKAKSVREVLYTYNRNGA